MKKVLFILGLSLAITACGGSSSQSGSDSSSAKKDTTTAGTAAESSKGAQLIAGADCATCHKDQEKIVGPAFADVAEKYKSGGDAIVDTLANKIIKGGSGNWGTTPMSPHTGISMEDARTIAKYILSIKKK